MSPRDSEAEEGSWINVEIGIDPSSLHTGLPIVLSYHNNDNKNKVLLNYCTYHNAFNIWSPADALILVDAKMTKDIDERMLPACIVHEGVRRVIVLKLLGADKVYRIVVNRRLTCISMLTQVNHDIPFHSQFASLLFLFLTPPCKNVL